MPFRASQLVIWLLVCLALTAAVFFLALRLLFPEVSESIFWRLFGVSWGGLSPLAARHVPRNAK